MIFGIPYFNIKKADTDYMASFKLGKKLRAKIILCVLCCLTVALSCFTGCNVLDNFFGPSDGQSGTEQGKDKEPNDDEGGGKDKDPNDDEQVEPPKPPIAESRYTADSDKIANFANGEPSWAFHKANGYSNGDMFNCVWLGNNINFNGGTMNVSITSGANFEYHGKKYDYAGGEYRTNTGYPFGYYSVSMKPAKCVGTVSSFFTYTSNPRWDEIDIEFLGKDTNKVQFNYYTDGVGGHEKLYDLGFDASEDFHEYGFYWQTDSIIWYVDGKAVYKATLNIPQYPGQIMTNVWNGTGVDEWLGAFDDTKLPVTAQYKWIGYKAA